MGKGGWKELEKQVGEGPADISADRNMAAKAVLKHSTREETTGCPCHSKPRILVLL